MWLPTDAWSQDNADGTQTDNTAALDDSTTPAETPDPAMISDSIKETGEAVAVPAPAEAGGAKGNAENLIATDAGTAIVAEDEPASTNTDKATINGIEVAVDEPALSYEDQLKQIFALYKEQFQSQQFDEAEITAKREVEITIRNKGPRHKDTAAALTNLAIVQYRLEQYQLAALNFEAAITALEISEDRLYSGLVNPLKGLAATYVKIGLVDDAVVSLDRAIHISRVNEGPQTLQQVEMLDSLTEIYLGLGDFDEADTLQSQAYNLQARQIDDESIDILPALFRRADWQLRTRRIQALKGTYSQIIRIIEEHRGLTDMSLIRPLTGLGKAYLYFDPATDISPVQRSSSSYGEVYLKRALDIATENPDATWRDLANAYLELGDFYTMNNNQTRARRHYSEAWEVLSIDESRLAMRARELEVPRLQQTPFIPEYLEEDAAIKPGTTRPNLKSGSITVGFDISYRGLILDPKIIEADPAGIDEMEKKVLRGVRQLIYRPRFEDGVAVPTPQQSYRHKFYYRDKDLPEKVEESTPEASN